MKTPESIYNKLRRKGYQVDFATATEKLNDLSGVRCICYSVKEIYWIARQISKIEEFNVLKAKNETFLPSMGWDEGAVVKAMILQCKSIVIGW